MPQRREDLRAKFFKSCAFTNGLCQHAGYVGIFVGCQYLLLRDHVLHTYYLEKIVKFKSAPRKRDIRACEGVRKNESITKGMKCKTEDGHLPQKKTIGSSFICVSHEVVLGNEHHVEIHVASIFMVGVSSASGFPNLVSNDRKSQQFVLST